MSSSSANSELITKESLEIKLGRKIKSFSIKAGSELGDNYMSILYALEVKIASDDSENGESETLHLLSKCYPANPIRQEFLNKSNIFWKELLIYKTWIPELTKFQKDLGLKDIVKPAFAPFVAGEAINFENQKDENSNQSSDKVHVFKPFDIYIMMVDLRKTWGFKMANRLLGIDLDHAILTFNALAEVHALSWAYKQKNEILKISEKFPSLVYDFTNQEDQKMWSNMFDGCMKPALEIIEAEVGKDSPMYHGLEAYHKVATDCTNVYFDQEILKESDLDNFMRIKPTNEDSSKDIPWRVVIHGDCWLNNMLFRYNPETQKPEQVILVDLQMCRDGCPTTDLSYFVYVSTDAEFRKKHLDSLLQIYTDRFISVCELMGTQPLPGFSFQEMKRRFHRAKLFGFAMSLFCLPIMLKDKENVTNLEELKVDNMEDIFLTLGKGKGVNMRYNKRLMEVIQDMYDDGII